VTVTNTGSRAGWAVPELYLHIPGTAAVPEPPDSLEGFADLRIAPHRSRRATIYLDRRSLSYWDTAAQAFRVLPGCDTVMVGSSSRELPLRARIGVGGGRC
jgi:beta-glucosidase